MSVETKDLEIKINTTKTYQLNFKEEGVVISIAGWTVYFTVKENMEDTDANAKINKTITIHSDESVGETLIELTSSDTNLSPKSYYYEIAYKDDEDNVGILLVGRITFKQGLRASY